MKRILPTRSDASGETPGEVETSPLVVSNSNRWSRIMLGFEGVEPDAWCELNFKLEWHPQESSRAVHDFAVVGVDFLTEDGSSIDFAYVPGLTRTQIDPHSWYVSGPEYSDQGGSVCTVSLGFFIPSPTRSLSVSIRSWRNSHPFTIRDQQLLQKLPPESAAEADRKELDWAKAVSAVRPLNARRTWLAFNAEPIWMSFAVLPATKLVIRGQIINEAPGQEGALARIVYRNARGEVLPSPYPETEEASSIGSFIGIPVHRQARRFTLDLAPPPQAASVDIGFQTRHDHASMELITPLEVSLDDDLMLEAISGDDLPDAETFLRHLLGRLNPEANETQPASVRLRELADLKSLASLSTFHDEIKALQRGAKPDFSEGSLTLAGFPAWPVPEQPQWTEDPFKSPAWRLEFQSLAWLPGLAGDERTDGVKQAIDLAVSWSRANPWGAPKDPISAHPRALAVRAETFLRLLSLSARSRKSAAAPEFLTLLAEAIRHAFALAQILGQNIFSHSPVHLHLACALLALARCLPRVPLAPYWTSLALTHVTDGFDRFLDENGVFTEQSFDTQLEIVSLGLILTHQLESRSDAQGLRDKLIDRLRKCLRNMVAVTAPSGSLPPFGDVPHSFHHASWLRRLLSRYGTNLLTDPDLARELSYPTGTKVFSSQHAGLVAARRYDHTTRWGYFSATLNGRHHEHGHHDCTSFVYSSGGAPWIIDPRGSHLHETGAARQYLVSSRAHNIALPDEREQLAGIGWIEAQEELEGASVFVVGSNVHGPTYTHRRIFLSLNSLDGIAVIDHFASQPRAIAFEGFLHFDTNIIAAIANTQMGVAYRKSDKLRIVPYTLLGQYNGMSIENGRNDRPSRIQGFVARPSGGLQPANAIRYRFSGHEAVCGGVVLALNSSSATILSQLLESDHVRNILARPSMRQ
ncbi:heparinase II/III domain-containing protein [Microvirga guangxiensis]|uniref:heparinase II/III domain-containing protein n=1 Tax=Microvirga guangxiensis TaxID=549386 RepID=UPI00158756D5|nr:heparinase II/III family protein [Microvirga guangxiensis]